MAKSAAITIEAHETVAVFLNEGKTRVEMHPGDKATLHDTAIHIEPVLIQWRESKVA